MPAKISRAVYRTRCYACGVRLTHNEMQDPDATIAAHIRSGECPVKEKDTEDERQRRINELMRRESSWKTN